MVGYNEPHVLLLVTQGAQKKISSTPPPRIKAIIAKIVHAVEAEVTRVDSSLLAAGRSTTSSVFKPNLLALLSKNLRRRDAFSQDILDDLFYCSLRIFSNYVPPLFVIVFKQLHELPIPLTFTIFFCYLLVLSFCSLSVEKYSFVNVDWIFERSCQLAVTEEEAVARILTVVYVLHRVF
ncbi:PREDICTED: uncharacterized protein LOC108554545 [Eufriesea mexicana]|uniref:uncharacterized protein LOC108554545 n=1 Tax=Eufriesea mexicana TaxID=516756 RepID=UPI00083BE0F1|nr:PREDICTED: uncharacterized protein LOC108554545 [Eufriesea mexicana]